MRTAIALWDIIGKAVNIFLVSIIPLQRQLNHNMVFFTCHGKNGGRKYSELTGFYLMPLHELKKQFNNPTIKKDPEKPTIFIEHKDQPKEERWKKLFIFEEEVNLIANVLQNDTSKNELNVSLFQTTTWKNLPSPWTVKTIDIADLMKLHENTERLPSILNSRQ